MKFCHECGKQLEDQAGFCSGCGTAQAPQAQPQPQASPTNQIAQPEAYPQAQPQPEAYPQAQAQPEAYPQAPVLKQGASKKKKFLPLILAGSLLLGAGCILFTMREDSPSASDTEEAQAPLEDTVVPEAVPEVVPEEAVPEEAIPEEAVPEEAVPEEAVPEEAVPEEAVPEEAVPEEAIPEEVVPEELQRKQLYVVNAIASSTFPDWQHKTYHANCTLDGDTSTAWVENASGIGVGEWIEHQFAVIEQVEEVQFYNGYGGAYEKNGVCSEVAISFSNGEIFVYQVEGHWNTLVLPYPVNSSSLRMTIYQAHSNADQDTCISEILIYNKASDNSVHHMGNLIGGTHIQ